MLPLLRSSIQSASLCFYAIPMVGYNQDQLAHDCALPNYRRTDNCNTLLPQKCQPRQELLKPKG
jgi:hypothetical protein